MPGLCQTPHSETLGLLIAAHSVKPTTIMKTLSGTFKLLVAVAIGVVAILSFRAFAQPAGMRPTPVEPDASKATFVLKIKNVAALKNENHFKQVLKDLKTQLYEIHLVHSSGPPEDLPSPTPFAKLDIKTDRVTVSEKAKSGELTLIQVHATHLISSQSATDIQNVAAEFQ